MCTFKDERTVLVCDVAIGRVQNQLGDAFGDQVRYTVVPGQGTLVVADPAVDGPRFTALAQATIAASQDAPRRD